MRWMLWGLLLGNILLLAYFNLPMQSEVALQITQTPLNPEKIKLLSPQEIEFLPPRVIEPEVPSTQPVQYGCYDWGTFSRAKLASAQNYLKRFSLEVAVRPHTPEEATRYWVYI